MGWTIFVIGLLLDQFTKWWVVYAGLPWFLNTGVAWGWGRGISFELIYMLLVVLIIGIGWYALRLEGQDLQLLYVSWWLLLSGSCSNFVDRMYWGGVVDWIHVVDWFPWFNIADSMISIGVIGLLLGDLFLKKTHD